ncbi:hypothetical protein C4Q26_24175 [Pseudomonas sp. SWI44]|nr:hypothetical protein C4Q26_24175 [Pseudomonas sp. SWI44]
MRSKTHSVTVLALSPVTSVSNGFFQSSVIGLVSQYDPLPLLDLPKLPTPPPVISNKSMRAMRCASAI